MRPAVAAAAAPEAAVGGAGAGGWAGGRRAAWGSGRRGAGEVRAAARRRRVRAARRAARAGRGLGAGGCGRRGAAARCGRRGRGWRRGPAARRGSAGGRAAAPLGPGTTTCADRQDPALRALLVQALPEAANARAAATTDVCLPGGQRYVSLELGGGVLTVAYLPPGTAPSLAEGASSAPTASGGTVVVSPPPALRDRVARAAGRTSPPASDRQDRRVRCVRCTSAPHAPNPAIMVVAGRGWAARGRGAR